MIAGVDDLSSYESLFFITELSKYSCLSHHVFFDIFLPPPELLRLLRNESSGHFLILGYGLLIKWINAYALINMIN